MSFKSIVRELWEMKDGIENLSRRAVEETSHINPGVGPFDPIQQGKWANLPSELLLDIIRRVEETEASWPARSVLVFCASVCKSWRDVTKDTVRTPEECGRLTFPISLKQPGPRESPIHCFIKRDRDDSIYRLFLGLTPSEEESDKLLLAAKRIKRATSTDFVISLVADDFSRASNMYLGKVRSNFMGNKFTMYDSQPPSDPSIQHQSRCIRRFRAKQVSPTVPACNYKVASISYEFNVLRTNGPRKMHCTMKSIPLSSIQDGGHAPTPTSFPLSFADKSSPKQPAKSSQQSLVLKNKAPRWHEQLQCWCLNFKGRVTVASVKNFQLVAAVDPPPENIPASEQERVILQFGKIGKDIFTMDYRYPLSAFQAFAICLSSFDTKLACEC